MTEIAEVRVDVLAARHRGESLRAIGGRLGLDKNTVARIERDHGDLLIKDLSARLLIEETVQRRGGQPHWPWIRIPFQRLDQWQDSLDLFSWTCLRLRVRHPGLQIVSRSHPDGGLYFCYTVPPTRRSTDEPYRGPTEQQRGDPPPTRRTPPRARRAA